MDKPDTATKNASAHSQYHSGIALVDQGLLDKPYSSSTLLDPVALAVRYPVGEERMPLLT
jgi:hypothetical protein